MFFSVCSGRNPVLRRREGHCPNRKGPQGETRKGRKEDRWSEVALVDDLCQVREVVSADLGRALAIDRLEQTSRPPVSHLGAGSGLDEAVDPEEQYGA